MTVRALLPALALCAGCLTLDSFVHNPVHCSTVGPETCEARGDWDAVCKACDDPLDWSREYPWFDGQLPDGLTVRPIPEARVHRQPVTLPDGTGELDLYVLDAHGDDPDRARTTIVHHHGNYAGIEHYQPHLRLLHEAGFTVIAWDYRGYGKSTEQGPPTPAQFLDDTRLVADLVPTLVPDAERIVVYGYSMGAIPAVEMARLLDPCALMLQAPFTSLQGSAHASTTLTLGERMLSEGLYDNAARMAEVTAPTLGMTGALDNRFPVDDVREVVESGAGPHEMWVLDGVFHGIANVGVVEAGYEAWVDRMTTFLSTHGCLAALPE